MRIERVTSDNFHLVAPLIDGYQRFYGAEPDTGRTREHFSRYLADEAKGIVFAAFDDAGAGLGFATIYLMPSSVSAAMRCVFNDLFTLPGDRGSGVGVALALHVFQYAKSRGFARISWETQKDNLTAQRLYDYTSAARSEWLHYELDLSSMPA